jgi:hypothetical protein
MPKVVELKPRRIGSLDKVKSKKYSLQFLPESLEPHVQNTYIDFKSYRLKSSYFVDIVHNLLLKYYFKKDNSFNLSSLILKEKYGDKYNYYMSFLVEKDILQIIRNHQKGKNARVYKLNNSILSGRINRFRNQDKVLLKKYRSAICSIEDDSNLTNGIDSDIKKKLVNDLFHVDIDFAKSIFYLDNTTQDTDIYNKNKYSVECINDNHIFYHFDEYGRLHTNFTILKSYIRKNCLLIDGEETCEIDIHNSQPLFLYKLIKQNDLFIVNEKELEFFKNLTVRGLFYQYLIDKSEGVFTKKEIKEMTYKVLFGRNYKNPQDDLFSSLFPTIYKFIKSYKRDNGNYKILSYSLQREESEVIFNKIVKKVMNLYPYIKIISVHDSLICPIKYKEEAKEIFCKVLNEEFNTDIFNI